MHPGPTEGPSATAQRTPQSSGTTPKTPQTSATAPENPQQHNRQRKQHQPQPIQAKKTF